jgi:hypothetical protein
MSKETNSNECYFLAGCSPAAECLLLVTQLDAVDPREFTHTRSIRFRSDVAGGNLEKWGHVDFNANLICVAFSRFNEHASLSAYGIAHVWLSKEGEVFVNYHGAGLEFLAEKIHDAGVRLCRLRARDPKTGLPISIVAGYVSHIREIGGALYVCGDSGQIYRRAPNSEWEHHDEGLYEPITHYRDPHHTFSCIDGNSEQDIYVVGDDACVCHYDGSLWTELKLPVDEHLLWVRCYGQDEVWISGKNGTLLVGSAKAGFKDVSGVDDNYTIECVCKFQGKVYAASYDGLFVYDPAQPKLGLKPVKSGLVPEVQTMQLDASTSTDGTTQVLWSFGVKDITWFDGTTWHRVQHPDNPPL